MSKQFLKLGVNVDKQHHTYWTKDRDIGNLPVPTKSIFCGDPSRGKTYQCKQLLCRHRPYFDYFFVVAPYESHEWDDCEPTEILPELPDQSFWKDYEDGSVALVLEDYQPQSKQEMKNLNSLYRFTSTHSGRGISIFLLHQSWFRIPIICRQLSNFFTLWTCCDLRTQASIAKCVSMEIEQLNELFSHTQNIRDSVSIDLTLNSPYKYRKNLFEPITLQTKNIAELQAEQYKIKNKDINDKKEKKK